ncbi:MAG: tRNA pseudouridine(13) synthase TruD [Gammaproteobacteria bacterium]|nr:tRNA pseudouridine(13) synthase TruD [Gammaproteobacteria bacterium]
MASPPDQDLVFPYPKPALTGVIKSDPEDFKVNEQLGFDPSGSGEHLFIQVEKRSLTTRQLIEHIARDLDLSPRAIGYAGLKDKQAVTRQWLSLHLPGQRQPPVFSEHPAYRVLERAWHDKKLRIGVHRSNRFEVVIRDIHGELAQLPMIIEQIRQHGFANYFGQQRFGQRGDNVTQALQVLSNRRKRKRLARDKRSLYISALRSELFNRILSRRIGQASWLEPLQGDAFILDGSHSIFTSAIDPDICRRYRQFDIHSAISLYGLGEARPSQQALAIEQAVIADLMDISRLLEDLQIKRGYRANRAVARHLKLDYRANSLTMSVELAAGSYLTSLLDHFIDTGKHPAAAGEA